MENKPKFKPDPKLKLMGKMGKAQIDAFLSHLATQGRVSASTQKQALNAIIFLYRHVLDQPIEDRLEPVKARRHVRPPTVMTQSEVGRVMAHLEGTHLEKVKSLHDKDLAKGFGEVFLPTALVKKYPSASREFRWQYLMHA